ncbi:MAG TPA: cytochrome D1 domain-containing protein [Pyrinomonadaceae bacterium]|nr:cytochrome D1 domain-containing protein [Pyrinomonadaceae bacterium]
MKKTHQILSAAALLICALANTLVPAHAQDGKAAADAKKPATTTTAATTTPAPTAATPGVKPGPQKMVKEGIEVEFTIEPVASDAKAPGVMAARDATVRFRVSDTATKTPLSGVRPSAWLTQREGTTATDDKACRDKVQSFLQGSMRARPDVDLNTYYILALNQEANVSVIDPLVGFGGSKLLTLVMLKSPGADWALTSDRSKLFVSMPLVNQVAVVDTTTWKVLSEIDAGTKPTRLALQPDEKYLWVGNDASGQGGVTVIDTATLKVARTIATGEGHKEIVFGSNNKFAFVANRTDGTLSVVDIPTLAKVRDVKTGASATSIAFSPLSNAVYVVGETEGNIVVVDSRTHQILTRIAAQPGAKSVRFAPGGRYGFVPNAAKSVVHIFDASTNRLVHSAPVGKGPDQVAFTEAFAYIRSTGTEEVSMIRLSTVGKEVDIVKFPGGQLAPGESPNAESLADAFVPAPEGNTMLVANPADKMIYYYSEGMAAPMGNFQNYRREPRSVMVVDRSLREASRGVYTTTVKLPKSGVYDVAFLLDSPRIVHCFETEAAPNPEIKPERQTAFRIEYLNKERMLRVGQPYKLRFKLVDTATNQPKDGLKDVRVLTFLAPGIWQKRDFAQPVGEGVYELNITAPQPGVYMVFVESRSQGVQFRDLPYLTLQASDTPAPAAAPAGQTK